MKNSNENMKWWCEMMKWNEIMKIMIMKYEIMK